MTKTMKIKWRTNSKRTIQHIKKRVKAVSLAITECNSPQRPASFFYYIQRNCNNGRSLEMTFLFSRDENRNEIMQLIFKDFVCVHCCLNRCFLFAKTNHLTFD